MAEKPWDKGFLMPELPAVQTGQRCLHCSGVVLWGGSLAACDRRKKVLCPGAHYDRRCNSWEANAYCKAKPDWSAEPAADIVGGHPEFL